MKLKPLRLLIHLTATTLPTDSLLMTAIPPTLAQFLTDCQQRVDLTLRQTLEQAQPSEKLRQAMLYASLDGGKRLRPVWVYGAAQALQGDLKQADAAACAVELIHCYSLAHDDLPAMDDDDLRRGKPSLHKAYDEATAILVGDGLQSLAFELLSATQEALSAEQQLAMVRCLSQAAGALGMVGGQSLDFEAVGQSADASDLETLHRLKTGALIRASVQLGALSCVSPGAREIEQLASYADNVGLAFQVQDDILDQTADTATLGKPQGSDAANNKPTYVDLLGLDGARNLAQQLTEQAISSLEQLGSGADRLRELATYITSRGH